jgi:transposase
LLIGRLPESWIPPTHILGLRARVRTRHLLSHQRTEWQQQMHAVLYHHGFPHHATCSRWRNANGSPGSACRPPPEQLTIALSVIDALELKLIPFDEELRAYARKQPGCRTLADQIYGVGGLPAVTILAELGEVRRFPNSRDVVRYAGLDQELRRRARSARACLAG